LLNTSSLGVKSFTVRARDKAGNVTVRTVHYTVVDGTAPIITIETPAGGAHYRLGEKVRAKYSCSDRDGRSDIRSCRGSVRDGALIHTSRKGRHSFTVRAVDRAGNTTIKTVHYRVIG
jgi:hypothetical protein